MIEASTLNVDAKRVNDYRDAAAAARYGASVTLRMDDLSTVPIDDVLDTVQRRLDRRLALEAGRYSRVNGTAGFPTDAGTWVRLGWRRPGRLDAHAWTGYEASQVLDERIPRPRWIATATWPDPVRDAVWRADEMTLATTPVLSQTAEISDDPQLPTRWWGDLRTALDRLAAHATDRVTLGQAHLTARIQEVYGPLDTTITDWAVAHGDLGYANLCGPDLTILDWESWGRAPVGWDAAGLWMASLPVPHVADRVADTFADVLATRSGQLTRLMLCANVTRAARRTGRDVPRAMRTAADTLLQELDPRRFR
ncbi:aminoglycoside phosphotransferase [Nonomuraea sp. NPDC050404]|uniref:aminoglycoside phosphotransferase n=1 Tax=Nonomuraea sp. NPDC050404 TaxID=3155783 RepID=UPI0033F4F9ED